MQRIEINGVPIERWVIGAATYETCLTRGARLMRWKIAMHSNQRDVLYWPADASMELTKIGLVRGGNPILFPFMGRTYTDGEKFFWKAADGIKRPMPQHGFARNSAFEIIESGPQFAIVRLVQNETTLASYPFNYEFRIRFDFRELYVRITFEFENRDNQPLPWCAGHHFYFTLPWHPGLNRCDYVVKVPSKKQWRHAADGKLVPFSELKGLESVPFDNPHLSDCIFSHLKSAQVRFGPRSGEEDISIRVGEDSIPSSWASVVTWTPEAESPYYCVEPWMGPPNSPEHKKGLRFAEPGEVDTFTTEVSLM